jgi:hypothetical protein
MIPPLNKSNATGLILLLVLLFSCSQKIETPSAPEYSFHYDSLKVDKYKDILHRLHTHQYPFDFRLLQFLSTDEETYQWNQRDEQILADSVAYYQALEDFFVEDIQIVHWLISFKHDTLYDPSKYGPVFQPYTSPLSSTLSNCMLNGPSPSSKVALNYIYGYLNGTDIRCVECYDKELACTLSMYEEVEQFLAKTSNLNIKMKRVQWQKKQRAKELKRIFLIKYSFWNLYLYH